MIGSSDLKARKILFIGRGGVATTCCGNVSGVSGRRNNSRDALFTQPLKRSTIVPLQFCSTLWCLLGLKLINANILQNIYLHYVGGIVYFLSYKHTYVCLFVCISVDLRARMSNMRIPAPISRTIETNEIHIIIKRCFLSKRSTARKESDQLIFRR